MSVVQKFNKRPINGGRFVIRPIAPHLSTSNGHRLIIYIECPAQRSRTSFRVRLTTPIGRLPVTDGRLENKRRTGVTEATGTTPDECVDVPSRHGRSPFKRIDDGSSLSFMIVRHHGRSFSALSFVLVASASLPYSVTELTIIRSRSHSCKWFTLRKQ